jgi:hypothetical protein
LFSLSEINFNIILPSMPESPLRFEQTKLKMAGLHSECEVDI